MLSALGYAAVLAALMGAAVMAIAGLVGGLRRNAGASDAARMASYLLFFAMTAAMVVMEIALLTHDFSVDYVARVGSRSTPTYYTAISLWSSLDGSILFWGWILAGYAALVAFVRRSRTDSLSPLVTAVIGVVAVFFCGLLIGPANPFGLISPTPVDGPGPNALLQNHPLMGLHPPMLYLGFVGFTVPFAFAIAALIQGNVEASWLREARTWTIAPWAFLSMGIVGGAWWSYEVLGWGGYWAWDPVENASLLPWLTGTAFVHSAMVQERRGMLKTWNLTLITGTFLLTLFGTFLTRSGVVDSVHAFTEGLIGPLFLGFIAVVALVSLALIGWRADRLHAPGRLDGVVSRESAFILNNLMFAALTFTVLLGTMFPLVIEALRQDRISVGPPYFSMVATPIGLMLLFLMGVGPVLPWRRTAPGKLQKSLRVPIAVGLVVLAITLAAGIRKPVPLLTFGLAGFVLTTIADEFRKGIDARRRIAGRSVLGALADLFERNGPRYGGYIVHTGVVVIAVALTISANWKIASDATLASGERAEIGPYAIELVRMWGREEPQRFVVGATFRTYRGERELGEQSPRLNFYPTQQQPIGTPAVHYSLREDLYLSLVAVDAETERATVRAMVNPAVSWLWLGGVIIGIGAVIAIWPRRREPRPTFLTAPEEAPAGEPALETAIV